MLRPKECQIERQLTDRLFKTTEVMMFCDIVPQHLKGRTLGTGRMTARAHVRAAQASTQQLEDKTGRRVSLSTSSRANDRVEGRGLLQDRGDQDVLKNRRCLSPDGKVCPRCGIL